MTEQVKKIKCMLHGWESEVKGGDDPAKEGEHLRTVVATLNTLEGGTYGGGDRVW